MDTILVSITRSPIVRYPYAPVQAVLGRGLRRNAVQLAFCWSHVRRRLYELAQAGPAPIATEALARVAAIYQIENSCPGHHRRKRAQIRYVA